MEVLSILLVTAVLALAGSALKVKESCGILVTARASPSFPQMAVLPVFRFADTRCDGLLTVQSTAKNGGDDFIVDDSCVTPAHRLMERRIRLQLVRTFERAGSYDQARMIKKQVVRTTPRPFRGLVNVVLQEVYPLAS
ncbi:hypothetical protein JXD20_01095 [Candidatus Peregrinibacteria bacterium]|nr:hypothetical protein [Candidatus Peregrinibacteria bacterium]